MDVKKFLKEFADKFGKTKQEKEDILKSNKITIDYADGVIDFLYEDPEADSLYFCFHGGSNSSIFKDEDYRFVWDNLVLQDEIFTSWMRDHNMTEYDMMVVCIDMYYDDHIDVHCSFSFYGDIEE